MAFLINNAWGNDDLEKATVAFVVANAAAGKGGARVFLTNAGLMLAVTGQADALQADGYPPLKELMDGFVAKGGVIWACKACADVKGITQDDLIAGAEIGGAGHTMGFLENGGQVLM